jgi:hypothetical protein
MDQQKKAPADSMMPADGTLAARSSATISALSRFKGR